jgi:hypothetical protein
LPPAPTGGSEPGSSGPYYWASLFLVAPGARLTPGAWGRAVVQYDSLHPHAVQERVFEEVRCRSRPTAPSRLKAGYAFTDHASALQWITLIRPYDALYEVRLVDASAPRFVGEIGLITRARNLEASQRAELEAVAELYWSGCSERDAGAELLTLSLIEVVKRIA